MSHAPPRELYPMFEEEALPLLRSKLPATVSFHCRTLRTCGLGESWVEEQLAPFLPPLIERGLEVGYCARTGEVDVRLVARGDSGGDLVREAAELVRSRLGDPVYGEDDDTLESVVIQLARERGARIALAESCTGGFVAHRLTNVPGASKVFWGGWVTYDNASKQRELGVPAELIEAHGAVSEPCAAAMAEGALSRLPRGSHAVAITGIAGPDGGTPEKPVGTVFISLASTGVATVTRPFLNPYDRETFKYVTSQQALEMLRRRLRAG
jgi:nicotinamide-nucleotide amidase